MALPINTVREDTSTSTTKRCPHAGTAAVLLMVGLKGSPDGPLDRFSCRECGLGWWESNGAVVDLDGAISAMRRIGLGRRPNGPQPPEVVVDDLMPHLASRRAFAMAVAGR